VVSTLKKQKAAFFVGPERFVPFGALEVQCTKGANILDLVCFPQIPL
jgi:hypothetical protein